MTKQELLDYLDFPVFCKIKGGKLGLICGNYIMAFSELMKNLPYSAPDKYIKFFSSECINELMELFQIEDIEEVLSWLKIFVEGAPENLINKVIIGNEPSLLEIPFNKSEYIDFYCCRNHVENMGKMFRDPKNPLPLAWEYIPIAYHGRASTIMAGEHAIKRPCGVYLGKDGVPVEGPSQALDFEVELAVITYPSEFGEWIKPENAYSKIFGIILLNDLSARDIQRFEYVPLGPFAGKNFGTVISYGVLFYKALDKIRIPISTGPKFPMPHLIEKNPSVHNIFIEVYLKTKNLREPILISETNSKYLSWSFEQMISHLTFNGCSLNAADVIASGTISGDTASSCGSLIEITWNGANPIHISNNEFRVFLEDYDTITMKAYVKHNNKKMYILETSTTILPSYVL